MGRRTRFTWRLGLGLGVCLVAAEGCHSTAGTDQAGGQSGLRPVVLTLADPIGNLEELAPFVQEVSAASGGTIRIDVKAGWRRGEADYETGLIQDVRDGKADLGVAGTRAFDSVGTLSLRALTAPLLITSYAAEDRVLHDPMIDQMLGELDRVGLTGLGVMPGPLRRPLGIGGPLVAAADYAGKTIGVQQSRVAEETMRAFGAKPVWFPVKGHVGAFGGIEQQIASIDGNRYDRVGAYLTANVALWPRPTVVFAASQAYDRLTGQQRGVLRRAAHDVLPGAMAQVREAERQAIGNLCRRGLAFVTAGPRELADLRETVQPVYDSLAQDPRTAAALTAIATAVRSVTTEPAPSCAGIGDAAPTPR